MTGEKVKQVTARYRTTLEKYFQSGVKHATLSHVAGMLPEIDVLIDEGRREKAFRWLGFVQGCLWSHALFTIEELKNHNRPDPE